MDIKEYPKSILNVIYFCYLKKAYNIKKKRKKWYNRTISQIMMANSTTKEKNKSQKFGKDYKEEDGQDGQEDATKEKDIKAIFGKRISLNSNLHKFQFKDKSIVDSAIAHIIPPHKRFRKLQLFDTPHTPKSLIKMSHIVVNVEQPKLLTMEFEEKYKSLESLVKSDHLESSQFTMNILKNARSKDSTPEKTKSSPTRNINKRFVILNNYEKVKMQFSYNEFRKFFYYITAVTINVKIIDFIRMTLI